MEYLLEEHTVSKNFVYHDPRYHKQILYFHMELVREFGKLNGRWRFELEPREEDGIVIVRYIFVNEYDALMFALKHLHD